MRRDTVNGVDVLLYDGEEGEEETGGVVYPDCVGCGKYFNEDPCEECGLEEA
uniref:Uncharacterized protein n=1 Tax=viral metagenome TaxID=1070528 RepID=A0A6M3LKE4_9ZZZZ